MRVIEGVILQAEVDRWLSLPALSTLSGMSIRTLRAALADPFHPLPHYRMRTPHVTITKAGKRQTITGKVLVRWTDFTRWMEPYKQPTPTLDRLVDEAVADTLR